MYQWYRFLKCRVDALRFAYPRAWSWAALNTEQTALLRGTQENARALNPGFTSLGCADLRQPIAPLHCPVHRRGPR